MSVSTQRYRTGYVSEVKSWVPAGDVAHVGDLVASQQIAGRSYSRTFDTLSEGTAGFANNVQGVLVQGATLGTETADTPCLVYTDGEFEFPLAAASAVYAPQGTDVAAVGSQTVLLLSPGGSGNSIGELCKECLVGDTTVTFKLNKRVGGGVPAAN